MATKRQSLGKGLDALLGIAEDMTNDQAQAIDEKKLSDGVLRQIPVEFLHAENISQDENSMLIVCKSWLIPFLAKV